MAHQTTLCNYIPDPIKGHPLPYSSRNAERKKDLGREQGAHRRIHASSSPRQLFEPLLLSRVGTPMVGRTSVSVGGPAAWSSSGMDRVLIGNLWTAIARSPARFPDVWRRFWIIGMPEIRSWMAASRGTRLVRRCSLLGEIASPAASVR